MADYKATFKRVEIKYILDGNQKAAVLEAMKDHMELDGYGRTEIRNIYFDTPDFILARRSNDHPMYKEKLRVRSYGPASENDRVFVELKKKYDGIVYKRRITLPKNKATGWLVNGIDPGTDSQIKREIDYMLSNYDNINPAMFLSYEREAYYPVDGGDLRLTLDENIRASLENTDLGADSHGRLILPDGYALMELKIPTAIPLWMVKTMNDNGIRKASFSKYGNAYKQIVLGKPYRVTHLSMTKY